MTFVVGAGVRVCNNAVPRVYAAVVLLNALIEKLHFLWHADHCQKAVEKIVEKRL